MSAMIAMVGDEESISMLDSIDTDSLKEAMNSMEGIDKTFITEEGGVLTIGYEFDDLNSLNTAHENSDMAESLGNSVEVKRGDKPLFSMKRKKLTYNPPILNKDGLETEDLEGMEGMGEMMRYEVVMNFQEPVKKVYNDAWVISNYGKTITFSISLDELMEGNSGATVIKF